MEAVLRALSIYVLILFMTRVSGRRTLSQVTVFDFVLVLLIADTTQAALVGTDGSTTNAVILIATLILTDVVLSVAKQRVRWILLLIDGAPTVLMREGTLDDSAIKRSRISVEDILQSARMQHGLLHLEDISFAVLETSGTISIIPKTPDHAQTSEGADDRPPPNSNGQ
jgi:uncharacterized membrane protein YcaP (DUF421 family)